MKNPKKSSKAFRFIGTACRSRLAARGGAYWSRIDQGAAAGVARNLGADESARFDS